MALLLSAGHNQTMNNHDPKIATLLAELAEMRQQREDWVAQRVNLNAGEQYALNRKIEAAEQFLRDLGVDDA